MKLEHGHGDSETKTNCDGCPAQPGKQINFKHSIWTVFIAAGKDGLEIILETGRWTILVLGAHFEPVRGYFFRP